MCVCVLERNMKKKTIEQESKKNPHSWNERKEVCEFVTRVVVSYCDRECRYLKCNDSATKAVSS